MNVTYDYYRIFFYVAKYGSFTSAARVMGSSQPNITRAMNNLEMQLGVKLFVRTKRGISLTYEGERLYEKIAIAFEQIRRAEEEIASTREYKDGSCTIGATDIGLYEILLSALPKIHRKYPHILIRMTNETSVTAVKKLREGLVDLAVVSSPIKDLDGLECIPLKSVKECAAVSKDYGLDEKKIYSLAEIATYPIVMLAEATSTRAFYNQLFAEKGIELRPQIVAGTVNQELFLIEAGMGIGFVPESVLEAGGKMKKVRIRETIPERQVCLLRKADAKENGAVRVLIRELMEGLGESAYIS